MYNTPMVSKSKLDVKSVMREVAFNIDSSSAWGWLAWEPEVWMAETEIGGYGEEGIPALSLALRLTR